MPRDVITVGWVDVDFGLYRYTAERNRDRRKNYVPYLPSQPFKLLYFAQRVCDVEGVDGAWDLLWSFDVFRVDLEQRTFSLWYIRALGCSYSVVHREPLFGVVDSVGVNNST